MGEFDEVRGHDLTDALTRLEGWMTQAREAEGDDAPTSEHHFLQAVLREVRLVDRRVVQRIHELETVYGLAPSQDG